MSSAAEPRAVAVSDRSARLIGVALAAAGVMTFSLRPVMIKLAYAEMHDPVTLLMLRMAFALPFFIAVALWTRRNTAAAPIARRDWGILAVLGVVGYYVASMLDFVALEYVPAGIARLLLFLYPTIVVILGAVFLGKRVLRSDVLALIATYAGIALVVSNTVGGPTKNLWIGVGFDLGSALAFAIYLVAGTEVIRRIGSLRFTAYAMIVASLACIAQFLLFRPLSALALSGHVYFIAFLIGTISTVLPVFMMSEALRRIGAKQVALIGALGPVTVIFAGHVGLDEHMTPLQILGTVFVLAGVVAVSLRAAK